MVSWLPHYTLSKDNHPNTKNRLDNKSEITKKHNIIDIIRYSTAERVLHNLSKVITRTECVQYNLYSSLCCEFNKMVQC